MVLYASELLSRWYVVPSVGQCDLQGSHQRPGRVPARMQTLRRLVCAACLCVAGARCMVWFARTALVCVSPTRFPLLHRCRLALAFACDALLMHIVVACWLLVVASPSQQHGLQLRRQEHAADELHPRRPHPRYFPAFLQALVCCVCVLPAVACAVASWRTGGVFAILAHAACVLLPPFTSC